MIHIIPNYIEADKWLNYSLNLNVAFEYNEFFKPEILDDDEKCRMIISTYKSLNRDRSNDTLHGAFFDMVINSCDPKIREISRNRFEKCIEIALELGCKAVVFHTNYIVGFKSYLYQQSWIDINTAYYRQLLHKYPNMNIYVENMFDDSPQMLKALADNLKDEPNFGVCFDIAHAYLWDKPLEEWINDLYPYIKHLHINDNSRDEDSHLAIGEGTMSWDILNDTRLLKNNPSILIEVKDENKMLKSFEFLKTNHYLGL